MVHPLTGLFFRIQNIDVCLVLSRSLIRHDFAIHSHAGGLSAVLSAVKYSRQLLLVIGSNGIMVQSEVAYLSAISPG